MPDDPAALVALASGVAEQAVDLLLAGEARGRATVRSKSTATDMVSEMDHASERLIVAGLLAARPDDGMIGEEGAARDGTSGLRWVVDPLDGTTNYLYGLPGWGVSIAAEDADGVVAGVVVDAVRGEVYTATRGGGAFRDGVAHRLRRRLRPRHRAGRHRVRLRRRSGGASRGPWSPGCCRTCATSAGSGPPPWTSAWWPAAASTPTSNGASPGGISLRVVSSPPKRAPSFLPRPRSDRGRVGPGGPAWARHSVA